MIPQEPVMFAICGFCNVQQELDSAIDSGWIPSYWEDEEEVSCPICPQCQQLKLQFNKEMGDYELKTK